LLESTRRERQYRELQSELAHANRVATMGQLTASIAHEIAQPIATARNNARAALNYLDRQPPDLGEVREALTCVVGDADRARDIIDRIRNHIKKAPPKSRRIVERNRPEPSQRSAKSRLKSAFSAPRCVIWRTRSAPGSGPNPGRVEL
jgi:C4-dicarboxylate-specific signal transduction histidine kinase